MKALNYAVWLSLLVLGGQSSFAAPQNYPNQAQPQSEQQRMRGGEYRHYERGNRDQTLENNHTMRSERGAERSMRVGAPIPAMYREAQQIDYTQHPKLSTPSRYQQWIKVNNRYLLINVLTNTVIKVMPE